MRIVMDDFFKNLTKTLNKAKANFEKYIWPNVNTLQIPSEVKTEVTRLPMSIQDEFYLTYDRRLTQYKRRRNVGLFFFIKAATKERTEIAEFVTDQSPEVLHQTLLGMFA